MSAAPYDRLRLTARRYAVNDDLDVDVVDARLSYLVNSAALDLQCGL